jgi:hypothetical protein
MVGVWSGAPVAAAVATATSSRPTRRLSRRWRHRSGGVAPVSGAPCHTHRGCDFDIGAPFHVLVYRCSRTPNVAQLVALTYNPFAMAAEARCFSLPGRLRSQPSGCRRTTLSAERPSDHRPGTADRREDIPLGSTGSLPRGAFGPKSRIQHLPSSNSAMGSSA